MNWKHFFRFQPRAGRDEFAASGLVCNLLSFGNLLLSAVLASRRFPIGATLLLQLLSLPISLVIFWAGIALYSRRLHDFNLSLWWYIIYMVTTTGISMASHIGAACVSVLGVCLWAFLALKNAPLPENRFGKTRPFFPQIFRRTGLFWLTVLAGILVCACMAAFSLHGFRRLELPAAAWETNRF